MTDNRIPATAPESYEAERENLAVEIEHLAEDILDAADAIARLTRQHAEEVQKILEIQAERIKALAAEQRIGRNGDKAIPES